MTEYRRDEQLERRALDERHRIDVSERITKLETTIGMKFGELASILTKLNEDVKTLNTTIYGGPKGMGLLGKVAIATSVLAGSFAFITQPVKDLLNHWAQKKIEDPQQMVVQKTNRRIQLFNRKSGAYEYFIEYKPAPPKQQDDE